MNQKSLIVISGIFNEKEDYKKETKVMLKNIERILKSKPLKESDIFIKYSIFVHGIKEYNNYIQDEINKIFKNNNVTILEDISNNIKNNFVENIELANNIKFDIVYNIYKTTFQKIR